MEKATILTQLEMMRGEFGTGTSSYFIIDNTINFIKDHCDDSTEQKDNQVDNEWKAIPDQEWVEGRFDHMDAELSNIYDKLARIESDIHSIDNTVDSIYSRV